MHYNNQDIKAPSNGSNPTINYTTLIATKLSTHATGEFFNMIYRAINDLALNNIKKENYDVRSEAIKVKYINNPTSGGNKQLLCGRQLSGRFINLVARHLVLCTIVSIRTHETETRRNMCICLMLGGSLTSLLIHLTNYICIMSLIFCPHVRKYILKQRKTFSKANQLLSSFNE